MCLLDSRKLTHTQIKDFCLISGNQCLQKANFWELVKINKQKKVLRYLMYKLL